MINPRVLVDELNGVNFVSIVFWFCDPSIADFKFLSKRTFTICSIDEVKKMTGKNDHTLLLI